MKQTIKLNESQLRNIIKESIKNVFLEDFRVMGDKEIKQKAEEYARHQLDWSRKRSNENPFLAWKEGFEDGAHSRDKEINMLIKEINRLKEGGY